MENQNYNHSDSEQLSADIEHIHKLASHLLEHYSEISEQFTLPELHANAKLQMLIGILHELPPADVAAVLESLPLKERVLVWKLAAPEEDGDVLLEVSDSVRESLIEAMDKSELVAAVEDMEADDLADLADDDEKISPLNAKTKMPTMMLTMVSNIITPINKNICYRGRFSLYFAPLAFRLP